MKRNNNLLVAVTATTFLMGSALLYNAKVTTQPIVNINVCDKYDNISVRDYIDSNRINIVHTVEGDDEVIKNLNIVFNNIYRNQESEDEIERIVSIKKEELRKQEILNYDWIVGYVDGTDVNVRKKADEDSEIIKTLPFNSEIEYIECNDEWITVKVSDEPELGYVKKKFLTDEKYEARVYTAPTNHIKSYMSYTMITATSSPQYVLQHTKAYSGNYGIRQVRGRYCVAIGSYYAVSIGTYFDLVLENGTVIPCILADQKDNKDTDSSNRITEHDGSLTEFVVDYNGMSHLVKNVTGDISYSCDEFNSPVESIIIYSKKEDF